MQMMRRTVLAMMSAAVLDVEALLWRPGKLISIPRVKMSATCDEVLWRLAANAIKENTDWYWRVHKDRDVVLRSGDNDVRFTFTPRELA